ncbi:non-ribosomal peptide synthetase [Trichoderma evansii]
MAGNDDLQKIWEWNAIVPISIQICIHDIIAKVAREQPNEPAICAWDGELTYRELDELSTSLSCQLNALDLGQGIVPLCFEKSVWMPVAMIAIFKAGGACAALDVTLPEERLRGIVQQVQPKVILSSFENRSKASRIAGKNISLKVVDKSSILNADLTQMDFGTNNKSVLPAVNPSDLLYVVFTSGSTGVPKGAKISHQNFASALHYQSEKLCFSSTSRVLDFASYAFDIAWFNFIFTLCCGGCLCIGSHEEMRNDPAACIQQYKVNFAHLTPSLTHIVSPEALSQLDILVTSGEILTASHAEKVSLPKKIINAYGPAECTPHATASVITQTEMMYPPIGRGYGACTWVVDLDDESRLVPIGEEGELWLEGPLVGEGYLNDEEKTSSVFVVDPPWLLTGAPAMDGRQGRLYKTGDIVRQNEDGTFMFTRRKDAQVKINGQRVELGEVEYHVRRLLRGSSQLVAEVIKPRNASSTILVIFICIDEFENKDKDALKASVATLTQGIDELLAQVVPSYMVPSAYIPTKEIPMTATGKTDRKALHEIGSHLTTFELAALDPRRQTEFQAPRTEAEEKMQSWWATVLGIEASMISLDDNFLHIGGDSIQAMKLPCLYELAQLLNHSNHVSTPTNEPLTPFSLVGNGIHLYDARQQVASQCGLDAGQIQDIFPCTPLQEGLLAMTVKRPGDYISERNFILRTGLDIERFKKACEHVVAILPILRTRIFDLPGIGLVQAILNETISWESTDEDKIPGRYIKFGDKLTRFNLSVDRDLRTIFKWKMHHALYDGWSVPLMLDAIETAYQGGKIEAVPFQRFVHYIRSIDKKAAHDYWYKYYELSQATIFPATPSPAYTSNVDEIIEHRFTNIAWAKTNITASTVIRTAWAMLQGAYTGSSDVAFGATVTGRQAAVLGVEQMAAPAIATVPVRVVWEPNQTLNELLQLVQQQSIDSIPYEQIGLREIRKVSQDAEHGCNFQALLVVQPPGLETDQSKVFEFISEHMGALNGFNSYALQLICTLLEDGLHVSISFDSAAIGRAELERIVSQFEHIVRIICDERLRARKLHEINILSNEDLQDIWNWNARLPETVDDLIHRIIEKMATQQPNSIAIRAWDGVLTYAELDCIASRFALYLAKNGVHGNVLVPLCFEKSMWTAVAMLSVMKAGAASLLLDINQPEERLRTIIRQVNPHIILSSADNESLATRLSDTSAEVEVISRAALDALSADSQIMSQDIMKNNVVPQSPLDLLYVVFTSGSTGIPKGVKISHQNFSSAVKHQQAELGFNSSSQVLDFASYAFDMAWSNFIFTLCTGGCLCVGSQSEMRDDLAGCLQRYHITFIQLTPSLARTIDAVMLSRLDVLLLAGEGLSMTDVDHASVAKKLLNAYGPAECSVCGTASNLKTHTRGPPPIGKGIGQCTWVVDPEDNTKLVPIGVEGELWLEGPLVGQGYFHNEEHTAAAFIQDPAWLLRGSPAKPGRKGRLYKTGDLVRYTADGALIFTGRKDSQVKIRGQRIELGEVEYHITKLLPDSYGNIQIKAEVVVPLDGNGEVMALFVCASDVKDNARLDELKPFISKIKKEIDQHLIEILPSYMIPSAFVPIAILPLTTTGKIDRKVLKRIGSEMTFKKLLEFQPNQQAERKSPVTKAEEQMCNLWATVLGVDPIEISADDSFLRIGGDSIQAMRLVSMARSQCLLFSVEDVFKQPRLCDLAKVAKANFNDIESPVDEILPFSLLQSEIDLGAAIKLAASLCGIQPEAIQDIFPCSPLQEGLIAMTEKQSGQYISRNEFELPQSIDPSTIRGAFEEMATNIPILRTRVVHLPGQGFVQIIVDEPAHWTEERSNANMGLGTRLNTISVTTKRDGKTTLTWLIHHALYDGWSFHLLLDALKELLLRNEPHSWPISLRPFIRHIQNIDVAASQEYWQTHFQGCEAAIFPVCPTPSYVPRVDSILEHVITNLTWPSNDITPSTVIRTAWSLLQAKYTTANDIVFGATVTGRQAALTGIERVAGPTIATIPVRIVLDPSLQIEEQLQKIQIQAAESMMYEHFGLQEIRKLSQEAELGCNFQALLVIQPAELNTPRNTILKAVTSTANSELQGQADVFSTYALEMIFDLKDSGVSLALNFDSAVIGAKRIQRIAEQFEHFLRLVCSKNQLQRTIGDLESACKQDLQDIWAWNSAVPDAVEMCIHDIIAETTKKQPSAPAICAWDGELSYKELDELSTLLSERLIELGVGRNVPVPLLFEKSMFMPLAMLSVMKAGGCCIAMDINQPEERLRTIIGQIKPTIILSSAQNETMASHLSEIAHIEGVSKSTLEKLNAGRVGIAIHPPVLASGPSSLLYIVFTSGSTGIPKGAQISHQNFASAIKHQSHHLGFTPVSRVLDFASYAFDMAWSNFLFTLCIGGCLCIGSYNEMQNDLAGCLQRYNISFAQLTPSLARTVDVEVLSALDTLILAGEGLQASDIERCAKVRNLINAYGPAECSVCATAANLRQNNSGLPIIGKGVGQCTWIVDPKDSSHLVPVGVEGELWLEGPLVGLGYLDDERTAASFIIDPPWLLNGAPGQRGRQGRLYKTGDLVRYNSDGSLIFIGRKDSQAKIRGQRLELGEVELHIQKSLQEFQDLQVVAEIVTPRDGSNQVLIAFLMVGNKNEEGKIMSEIARLRGALSNTIPSYMIPSAFIPLDNFPMTTTGKTDRKRFREIGSSLTIEEVFAFAQQAQQQKREPRTLTEKKMQRLWAEILEINSSQISIDDSFLRIGDSIQAIKLVRAAREQGLSITVADIFKHPQLLELAQVATAAKHAEVEDQIIPFSLLSTGLREDEIRHAAALLCGVESVRIQDVFPCTPLQEGLLALTEKEFGDYVSQNEYILRPGTDIDRFKKACETVFGAFPILRTRIVDLPDQGLVQVIVEETMEWQTNKMRNTGLGKKLTQFHLTIDEDFFIRFSWEIHHALYDGWTFPILLNAIASAYEGKTQFSTTPFQAFIRHLQNTDRRAASDFWQAQFKGLRSSPFPPRPSVRQPRIAAVIDQEIIDIQWPDTNITAPTAIRAAWALVQGYCSGSNDILFGTIALGRQLPVLGIEQIAGPTIATVPVRIALNPSVQTVGEFLRQVQQQAIDYLSYEQMGLQEIRRVSQESQYACDFSTLLVIQPEGQSQLQTKLFETIHDNEAWLNNLSTYPLLIICELHDQGVKIRLSFDSTVVGADRVQRIAEQFEHVLRLVCAEEQTKTKLDAIDFITKQDLQDIWKWNATVPETLEACVHDLVAETIAKHPNSLAVDAWDGTLTYKELDHFSNLVAIKLIQAGIEPNMPVPLLFEKSMWMPVSILGVLKAGATSVALDSSQPEERLKAIIRQVQPKIILSSTSNATLASQLGEMAIQVTIVCKEMIELLYPTAGSTADLQAWKSLVRPFHSLYIIFTSGSTGVPKGARVSHKSFASAMKHQMKVFGFNSTSRVIDFASYAFDMLWTNYLFTFYAGGCLCIRPKSEIQNDLTGCLQRYRISYAFLTPSLARTIDPAVLSQLDVLAFGGEGLLLSDVTRCAGIGKGHGQCTWIVDPKSGQKLVPIGAEGELWLEGPLVGQGYLDNRQTLATYEEDPVWLLSGAPGVPGRRGRLYKTGDLVRYDSDGTLIFCGRKDSQVKIRGQRVELSEVEYHAQQHLLQNGEDIRIIAEIVFPKFSDNALLVMFICLRDFGMAVGTDERLKKEISALAGPLQEQLSKKIPSYMVPSAFIPVETMPMTGTGKTDRRALREIASKLTLEELAVLQPQRRKSYREPQSMSEKRLQALWSIVLGIDAASISADDSFLRIGGDSIQAMRLVAAAREQGLALTVADIFEQPELSDLAQLMKEQDELITTDVPPFSLLSESANRFTLAQQAASLCKVQTEQIQDIFPCTPLQEGLLAMTEKHSGDYISQNVYKLEPEIDTERFKNACESVVDSLPILRTRIIDLPGEGLVQVVVDEHIQWNSQQDHIGLGTKLNSFGLHHEGTNTQFLWTIHHALYDGWSFAIMLNAILKAYNGEQDLTTVPLQRYIQYIQETDSTAAIHFWRCQFEGSRPAIFPHFSSLETIPRADSLLRREITHLSFPKTNITASTAIKTAWALVQGIFTNSDDVVFGATVTGRQIPVAGVEQIAAPLIATVPVRAVLDQNVHVSRLLEEMQRQSIDSTPYEHIGLQEIRKVSPEAQQGCDFQTLLVIQPSEIEQISNAIFKPVDMTEQGGRQASAFSTYALELVCILQDEGLAIMLNFDSRIVKTQEAKRILNQFEHILRLVCTSSQQEIKLNEIQITSEQDMEDIWKWNSVVSSPNEMCVHDLLVETARKQPNAPAIHAWDGQLSYGELDLLSSRFAAHLMREGVTPSTVIPLCFEKSVLTPVAMLAVMKLGAASVALDINQPKDRLRSIVQQVQAKVILASATNKEIALELAEPSTKVEIITTAFLNDLMNTKTSQPQSLEHTAIRPSNLLYAVFTSGSTGLPKGVLISHQNIASTIKEEVETLGFKPRSRVLDFASYAFDMSWFNFIFTLYTGGCLCIGSQEEMHNDLTACIQKYKVSYVQLTPSLARSVDLRSLSNLSVLALAGEALSLTDAEYFCSLDNVQIVNIYGPAECTPCSTVSLITADNKTEPPIGRGRGLRTWVVDQETGSRLVPIGIEGELWLEGPLVGRGYFNDQSGQTSSAFIEDPTWLLQGSGRVPGRRGRLYKTRDLVRYNASGELIFIGRKDSQAKIRGQRVELTEVEYHVKKLLPSDDDIHVIAEVVTPYNSTGKILIAFIHLKSSSQEIIDLPTTLANLDSRLADKIPSYMIPAAFMPLTAIPMTATGKTDRKALREMGNRLSMEDIAALHISQQPEETKAPLTSGERRLRQLWASVLSIDSILIDANTSFLRIGDSIQAMRLVAIAREQGMLLTVADIFKHPRLCDQAKHLKWNNKTFKEEIIAPFSLLKDGMTAEFVQLQAASLCDVSSSQIEDVLPCTPLQEGLLAMAQKRSGNYIAHIQFILQSDIDLGRFIQACEAISTEMSILRTRVINLPGQGLVQSIVDEPVQWEDENSLDDLSGFSASGIMGLGTRLSRFRLLRDDKYGVLFSWTIHHALYDNILVSMVLDAIDKAYRDEQRAKYVPFQRFISYIHDIGRSAAIDFWKEYFDGSQAAVFPQLPLPRYAPSTDKIHYAAINNITWPDTDITPATLIRTAWALLQALHTSSNDVVFGCTVTGRQAAIPGAEHIAGPTVATVPVRIKFPEESDMTVEELQAQIQQQSIDSIPFEQMGLQNIRRMNKDAENSCEFQTLLVVQPANLDGQASIFKSLENPRTQQEADVSSTYALEVVCDLNPHGLSIKLIYDSNVIDNKKIARMQDQFEHILRLLCEEAHKKTLFRDLSLIDQSDLETVWNWNASVPETVKVCIHDIISDIAQKQPYAPAICAWDGELTYMELESLAYSLSLRLTIMGIGPNVIVPLCFEKSMWTAVTAYAVWKTGAACFLVDTNQPEDRLQSIVRQIRPKAILSSAANKALAYRLQEAVAGIQLLDVTRFFDDILGNNNLQLPHATTKTKPTDLLYVVFTSGSTGTPKGATVSHQNFASAIRHQTEGLGFNPTSRVLDFASYAFDMSWSCMLFALCNGGCLCVGSQAEMRNDLAGCFRRYQISHVSLTPSVARTIDPVAMSGLDVLLLAGEAMSPSDISLFKGIPTLLNAYGPSECSICATAANVNQFISGSAVPIGKGIGQRTWVVDPSNGSYLVPIGVEGELWLEGPLVGQGYLNDEERTSAAFIHDPSWLLKGLPELGISGRRGRLYKTGDIVRYQPDGTLTFVGRKDSQAKIHGQRLELGEVEHHVQQLLPKDQDVRIVAEIINPRESSAILAIFISIPETNQPQAQAADIASKIRQSLAKLVPSYMIPSVFIPIDAIPTTVTGKIDRKALKTVGSALTTEELAALDPKRSQQQRLPTTVAEKQMQNLWASILDVDASNIYLDDSFYTVGGDSIQAMRLVVAAREQGLSLTITDILASSSLSELIHLESSDEEDDSSIANDTAPLPFSLLGDGSSPSISTLLETVPKLLDPDIISFTDVYPVTTVQADFIEMAMRKNPLSCAAMYFNLPGDMTDVELVTACSILWDRFDILRAIFIRHEGAFFHVISDAIEVPMCIHPIEKDLESSQLHSRILSQPLQLGRPFTMFHVQRSAHGPVRLTIRIAHAQYDGLSLGPLLAALSALLSHQLPPLIPQFSRYIKHIQYLEEKSFPFWKSFLENSQPLQMPTPRNLEHSTGKVLRLSRTIPAPGRIDRTTSATVFIAACAHALAKFTHSMDLIFGLIVSGRSSLSAELKDIMGPCLNIVPIRAKIQQDTLLEDIISQVQSQRHRSVAYEAAGSKNLLQNCTDWTPSLRRYNCIVQFQNIDESPALFSGHGPQLNVVAKPGLVHTNDIFIIVKPAKDHWSLEISGSDSYDLKQLREFLDGRYFDGQEGACGCGVANGANFPWQLGISSGVYTAAGSQALYDTAGASWCGAGCGKCYNLTSTGQAPCSSCGTGGVAGQSIIVMVTNLCPNNGNAQWCPTVGGTNQYGYSYHFDIMAQSEIFGDNVVVDFEPVACPGQANSDWGTCLCVGQQETDPTPVGLGDSGSAPPPGSSSSRPPSTSTSSAPTGSGTQSLYGQCGGVGWTGPTACQPPATCKQQNDYYSQCLD